MRLACDASWIFKVQLILWLTEKRCKTSVFRLVGRFGSTKAQAIQSRVRPCRFRTKVRTCCLRCWLRKQLHLHGVHISCHPQSTAMRKTRLGLLEKNRSIAFCLSRGRCTLLRLDLLGESHGLCKPLEWARKSQCLRVSKHGSSWLRRLPP